MDNAKLDELERVATAAAAFVSGGENPLTAYLTAFPPAVATALITAARRPALPDREAVELILRDTLLVRHGYDAGNFVQDVGGIGDAADAILSLFALSPAQAEREGWVLVPREPTEAMIDMAAGALIGSACPAADAHRAWTAMLSAASKEGE